MRLSRTTLGAAILVVSLGASSSALAQARRGGGGSSSAGASGGDSGSDANPAVRTEGGRRVYVSTRAIEVRGEIQRPYAFLLSGRGSLGYTYFDQAIHFVQEIINAVRRAPF